MPGERDELLRALRAFTRSASQTGVPIEWDVVEAPNVYGEILAQAGQLDADLIVMGTHGRTGFQRLFLGSVTEKVLRTARQPVMTVGSPSGARDAASSFKRILCGVDFSACSIAALRYAMSLAEGAKAHVTAVNIVEWLPVGYGSLVGPGADLTGYQTVLEAAAHDRLHNVIAGLPVNGVLVDETVTSGKPHHEILRLAAEQGSDLIVLGIHGRNPVDRMMFGSTAEPVARRATCPVLTVRADVAATVAAA